MPPGSCRGSKGKRACEWLPRFSPRRRPRAPWRRGSRGAPRPRSPRPSCCAREADLCTSWSSFSRRATACPTRRWPDASPATPQSLGCSVVPVPRGRGSRPSRSWPGTTGGFSRSASRRARIVSRVTASAASLPSRSRGSPRVRGTRFASRSSTCLPTTSPRSSAATVTWRIPRPPRVPSGKGSRPSPRACSPVAASATPVSVWSPAPATSGEPARGCWRAREIASRDAPGRRGCGRRFAGTSTPSGVTCRSPLRATSS